MAVKVDDDNVSLVAPESFSDLPPLGGGHETEISYNVAWMQVIYFLFGEKATPVQLLEIELGPVVQEEYLDSFKQVLYHDAETFDHMLVGRQR